MDVLYLRSTSQQLRMVSVSKSSAGAKFEVQILFGVFVTATIAIITSIENALQAVNGHHSPMVGCNTFFNGSDNCNGWVAITNGVNCFYKQEFTPTWWSKNFQKAAC